MNDNVQQKKLEQVFEIINSNISKKCQSAMVVGSFAHSKNHSIKKTSDIDMIIISDVDGVQDTLSSRIYSCPHDTDLALKMFDSDEVDVYSTRESYSGILFTVHYIKQAQFMNKFAKLESVELDSFRLKRKADYVYNFLNFEGKAIEYIPIQQPYKNGFLMHTKTCLFVNDYYFAGSAHNKLMSEPLILFDNSNIVKNAIDSLRKDLILQIVKEQGIDYLPENFSIFNTLIRKERLNENVKNKLLNTERNKYQLVQSELKR